MDVVTMRMRMLLAPHPQLVAGFNGFLSRAHKIGLSGGGGIHVKGGAAAGEQKIVSVLSGNFAVGSASDRRYLGFANGASSIPQLPHPLPPPYPSQPPPPPLPDEMRDTACETLRRRSGAPFFPFMVPPAVAAQQCAEAPRGHAVKRAAQRVLAQFMGEYTYAHGPEHEEGHVGKGSQFENWRHPRGGAEGAGTGTQVASRGTKRSAAEACGDMNAAQKLKLMADRQPRWTRTGLRDWRTSGISHIS